ncbi:hypothetical protein PGB90_008288 [Kerria lacca]
MSIDFNDTDDNYENLTVEEYLLSVRGPRRLPLNVVLPITIVYVMIFVTGVVGNVAVCVVIIRNVSLHTATNYYLFSLAVSDLTLLLLVISTDRRSDLTVVETVRIEKPSQCISSNAAMTDTQTIVISSK